MKLLGIHDGHCASACVAVDGEMVAVAAEERFTRAKNDHGYPKAAVEWCLEEACLEAGDLDRVVFAGTRMNALAVRMKALRNFTCDDWIEIHHRYWKPRLYEGREDRAVWHDMLERYGDQDHWYDLSGIDADHNPVRDEGLTREIRLDGLRRHLGVEPERAVFHDHHACHAWYAFIGGPSREPGTMALTLDGGGDGTVSSLWRWTGETLEEVARSNGVDTARWYRETTLLLGMKLGEHEYKVMGLAPYAPERERRATAPIFGDRFTVEDDLIAYVPGRKPPDQHFWLKEQYEGRRFDGIAWAVQDMVETSVGNWVRHLVDRRDARHVVFAGGVAMNVKLNRILAEELGLESFHVCPSPTDDTLPLGAVWKEEVDADPAAAGRIGPLEDPYLGPAYDTAAARAAVDEVDLPADVRVSADPDPAWAAEHLAAGRTVARACARMEFGARALGNRSILADPRSPATVDRINRQIKYRDFWMPFAPVVLEERLPDYFPAADADSGRRFMMIAAESTALAREELPAALHPADWTGRPQVLRPGDNPPYRAVVEAFQERTGVGALLNTSFNLHGEPIVCTPADAVSTFLRSELDALWLDGVALERDRTDA